MDIITLTTFLSPCLPFLIKMGEKSAEGAAGKIGVDVWEKAKRIWEKLYVSGDEKNDIKIAAEQLAAKPDSEARKSVFQEELETLLEKYPDVAEEIAKIMNEGQPIATVGKVTQTVMANEGQVVGIMSGGKAIGRIDGNIQGGVNL